MAETPANLLPEVVTLVTNLSVRGYLWGWPAAVLGLGGVCLARSRGGRMIFSLIAALAAIAFLLGLMAVVPEIVRHWGTMQATVLAVDAAGKVVITVFLGVLALRRPSQRDPLGS